MLFAVIFSPRIIALTTIIRILLAARTLLMALLALHLALLSCLRHRIQNAEIMLGMLKIGFCQDTIARARSITTKLEIFLEKLLGGAAHPHVRAIAIEDMVAIQRRLTIGLTRSATARAMVTASHTFHVHGSA